MSAPEHLASSDGNAGRILEMISGGWRAQAIAAAADLKLADHLLPGPQTVEALAQRTATMPEMLHRLLRALVTLDICRQRENGEFEITEEGARLAAGHPASLRAWALWWGRQLWPLWGELAASVRTGRSARTVLLQTEGFDHLERDPAAASMFNDVSCELTRLTAPRIIAACNFRGARRIADVGGGSGELLCQILSRNSDLVGVLFERPHAISAAVRRLASCELTSRCETVEGDFFESIPVVADVFVMKSVLHDWDDGRAQRILRNLRRAMGDAGRLLIIEQLMPPLLEASLAHQALAASDLCMLLAQSGRERTEQELRGLLESAGLIVSEIRETGTALVVIEARPARPNGTRVVGSSEQP